MSYVQDEEAVAAALAKTKLSMNVALPEPPPMGQAMLPPGTYQGRVVAITGGGGGLGRGFAREFARLEATVTIQSRGEAHMARGKAVVEEVGGKAVMAKMDVRDPAEIAVAFDKIENEAEPVDVYGSMGTWH
jgi:FlaA1/EpsC-like NDP-sugar epimerase